jgi:L-cystine uptake protein TcyP (sodium:dicarboxylate symporter family)
LVALLFSFVWLFVVIDLFVCWFFFWLVLLLLVVVLLFRFGCAGVGGAGDIAPAPTRSEY